MTYVVTGVTGNTGKVAAETLLALGKRVRVVVRDATKGAAWKARGAEVAVADLTDAAALTSAFQGAIGAYVLVPTNHAAPDMGADQARVTEAIASAARAAEVPHVVLLSSIGAQHAAGTGPVAGLHVAEEALGNIAGTALTSIRAAYFMENFATSLGMLDKGILPSFFPADFAFEMIATADIGKVAADALVSGGAGGEGRRAIELGSVHTTAEAAEALTRILGKPVQVNFAPLDAVVPELTSAGVLESHAKLYRELYDGFLRRHVAFEGGHTRTEGTTSLETVLRGLLAAAG